MHAGQEIFSALDADQACGVVVQAAAFMSSLTMLAFLKKIPSRGKTRNGWQAGTAPCRST
jgi:hypothetical protein